jgi:hypothetical protein
MTPEWGQLSPLMLAKSKEETDNSTTKSRSSNPDQSFIAICGFEIETTKTHLADFLPAGPVLQCG